MDFRSQVGELTLLCRIRVQMSYSGDALLEN